jgi:hypothetical protein
MGLCGECGDGPGEKSSARQQRGARADNGKFIYAPLSFFACIETKSGMYDMLKVHVHRVQRQFRRTRFHGEILQRAMSLRTRRMRIEHIKKALKKHGVCGQLPCVELRAVMPHGDTALASLLLMHAEIAFTDSLRIN